MATGDSHANVDLIGSQGGQVIWTHLDYYQGAVQGDADAADFAAVVETDIWDAIKFDIDSQYRLEEIRVIINQVAPGPTGLSHTLSVNEPGQNLTGEAMPPNTTARIIKSPDNASIEPITATPFRLGRAVFSGLPETYQNNGLLTVAAVASWTAILPSLLFISVDYGSGPVAYQLGMFRAAEVIPTEPLAKVLVSSISVSQKVGTQNTRKR